MAVEQINDQLVSKLVKIQLVTSSLTRQLVTFQLVNNELVILPLGDFQVSYFVTNWSFLGRTVIQLLNSVNHKNRNVSYYNFLFVTISSNNAS